MVRDSRDLRAELAASDEVHFSEDGMPDVGEEPLLEWQPVARWRALGGHAKLLGAVAGLALTFASARSWGLLGGVFSSAQAPDGTPSVGLRHGLNGTVGLAAKKKKLEINSRRRRRWKKGLGNKEESLEECMGDCNWDLVEDSEDGGDNYVTYDDCPGTLKCYKHHGNGPPPGCVGKEMDNIAYCVKDPNAALMMVSAKRARTDLQIALSQRPSTRRIVDMVATSSGTLQYHLKRARTPGKPEFAYLHDEKGASYKHVIIQEYDQIVVKGGDKEEKLEDKEQWAESTAHLKALDEIVRKQGGRTVLFQVWGRRDYFDEQMPQIRRHIDRWQQDLTRCKGGKVVYSPLIAPMGLAYQNIKQWSEKEFKGLFMSDNEYHESESARYLGAMVLFETLTGESCIGLDGPVDTQFSAAKKKKFQEAAHKACEEVTKIPLHKKHEVC